MRAALERQNEPLRGGGRIIGLGGWLPKDVHDFDWGCPVPDLGCNTLVCGDCQASVRSWSGLVAIDWAGVDPAVLYAHQGAGVPAGFILDTAAGNRVYGCRCRWTQLTGQQLLEVVDAGPQTPVYVSQWRCAGHPAGMPADLAMGVPSTRAEMASQVGLLLGRRSALVSETGKPFASPCLDLWRYEAQLDDTFQQAMAGCVQAHLASTDIETVYAALEYLRFAPSPEAGRAWLRRLGEPDDIGAAPDPAGSPRTLKSQGLRLLEVLGHDALSRDQGPESGLVDALLSAARELPISRVIELAARLALPDCVSFLLEGSERINFSIRSALERAVESAADPALTAARAVLQRSKADPARKAVVQGVLG